jgi:coatomer protein complex subunit epsilon
MADELYEIRNAYVLGNYGQVISDGSSLKANPYRKQEENEALLSERDTLVFKAHIGMGQYDIVVDDLANSTSHAMKAIRILAQFLKADHSRNETLKANAVTTAKELVKACEGSLPAASYVHVAITVTTILIHNGELEPALKCLRSAQAQLSNTQSPSMLELHSLAIDILLRIYRPDQAEKELKLMQTIDDDATLTQLSSAWVSLAQGGEKVQDAIQVFDDLREKFGSCVLLLNGLALAHMTNGTYDLAEKCLLDAMSKRSNDPETLINVITCSHHLRKPTDLINRYVAQLRNSAPNHPWMRAYCTMEGKFDTWAEQHKRA